MIGFYDRTNFYDFVLLLYFLGAMSFERIKKGEYLLTTNRNNATDREEIWVRKWDFSGFSLCKLHHVYVRR